LMQDRICQIDENLLHRTAGPYIWVKTGSIDASTSSLRYPHEQTFVS
jgi:hypothetical protein